MLGGMFMECANEKSLGHPPFAPSPVEPIDPIFNPILNPTLYPQFTNNGLTFGSGPGGANSPQAPTPQQKYQQCMAAFNNSTTGKVVSFFSALNIPGNLSEWFGLGGAKVLGVKALDKAEASAAPSSYSMATGEATDAVVNVGSKMVGEVGLLGIGVATGIDADVRLTCSGAAY